MSSEQRFFVVVYFDREGKYKPQTLVGVFSNLTMMFNMVSSKFKEQLDNGYVTGIRKNLDATYPSITNTISRDNKCTIYSKEDNEPVFKIQVIHMNTINPMFNEVKNAEI